MSFSDSRFTSSSVNRGIVEHKCDSSVTWWSRNSAQELDKAIPCHCPGKILVYFLECYSLQKRKWCYARVVHQLLAPLGDLALLAPSSIFFMVISCPLSILATEFMQTWGFWGSSNLSASLIWFNVEVGLSSAILVTHWVISTSHLTLKLPPRCLATSSNNGPRGCTLDTHLFCRLLIVFISLKSSGKSFFVHSWNLGSRHLESITECVCRNRLAIFIRARVSCKHCGLRVPTSLFNRQTTWLCRYRFSMIDKRLGKPIICLDPFLNSCF